MQLIEQIKKSGLKATPNRVELLESLYLSKHPQSYEDIRNNFSMDKATFYRNMATFEEKGFISSIESPDKRRYYEYVDKKHPHFFCLSCRNIECLREKNFELENYQIETISIKGYCPKCLEKE
jgi:Fur family ferric uptake transcriptional regulator